MRPDSYLFTVAAIMNVQLIVALLIANVVVANASYRRPGPKRGRNDHHKPWLGAFPRKGLSNTPDLSPMEDGHKQPDTPEVSSRETY